MTLGRIWVALTAGALFGTVAFWILAITFALDAAGSGAVLNGVLALMALFLGFLGIATISFTPGAGRQATTAFGVSLAIGLVLAFTVGVPLATPVAYGVGAAIALHIDRPTALYERGWAVLGAVAVSWFALLYFPGLGVTLITLLPFVAIGAVESFRRSV